jgi:hypothetical protein
MLPKGEERQHGLVDLVGIKFHVTSHHLSWHFSELG